MTFLPIVERELRVAARRRFTYWSRLVAAAFLLLVFGMILTLAVLSQGLGGMLGTIEFGTLRWIAFVFCASVGIFLTSDSLSEEKREGTLGLLFLTDLRGFDVVLGKLFSQSLQSFYGILAASPILALTLMIGGVTGVEFGRTMLVLCNTAFFSLAIGLLASSLSREVLKAMNAAFFLSLFFLVFLPWLDFGLADWDQSKWKCVTSAASPGYLFYAAGHLWPKEFWLYAGAQHLLAWCFLAVACFVVPRTWQEKVSGKKGVITRINTQLRFGGRRARLSFRKKFLDREPIQWLAMRDRWLKRFVFAVMIVALGLLGWDIYSRWNDNSTVPLASVSGVTIWLTVGLVLWVGSQAGRFYSEAVRNGTMELILVTPVSPKRIVRSQWRTLMRAFLLPVCLLVGLIIANELDTIWRLMTSSSGSYPSGYNPVAQEIIDLIGWPLQLISMFAALAWFGMWMGLKNPKILAAVFKTILLVCILPLLVEWFATVLSIIFFMRFGKLPYWLSNVVFFSLDVVKNILFIAWAWWRLTTRFRETVAQAGKKRVRRWKVASRVPAPAPPITPQPLVT